MPSSRDTSPNAIGKRPILVSIPHAGARVPEEVQDNVALTSQELLHYTDLFTDAIFHLEDVHCVVNDISRVIVDVNRAPDDISTEYKEAAEGVIVHTTWDGKRVYKRNPSSALAGKMIRAYHDSYHDRIDTFIPHVQFLFDCHSYLPVGPKLKADSGMPRPDVNIGNVNYSTCSREQTIFVREFFQDRGYSVAVNFPYTGKYVLGHHCHRRRMPPFLVPGLQIEINEALYADLGTLRPLPGRVEEFHQIFSKLVEAFVQQFCPE
jgi:N-formylglutamate deformylase